MKTRSEKKKREWGEGSSGETRDLSCIKGKQYDVHSIKFGPIQIELNMEVQSDGAVLAKS